MAAYSAPQARRMANLKENGDHMVSFEKFVMEDGIPIYQQIIRHIKRGIVAGIIQDQDEMPSRRTLSALLGVNPNTIQKAYRILEEEELLVSRSGAKSYVAVDSGKAEQVRTDLLHQEIAGVITAMKQMGMLREEAVSLIEELWEEV